MSWIALLFTQFFAAALVMVLLDRIAGTSFFIASAGGKPLLYQHIFWFYPHPLSGTHRRTPLTTRSTGPGSTTWACGCSSSPSPSSSRPCSPGASI
jgi:hypothetical protein